MDVFALLKYTMKKVKNQTPKLKKKGNFCKYLCKTIVGDRHQP